MKFHIATNKQLLGKEAARRAALVIQDAIGRNDEARVIFASAASQFEFLEALIQEDIDWTKVHGFHLDEYCGISADHPASFRRFLRERLLNKLPERMASFTFVEGDAKDVGAECARLEKRLRVRPIDLACIGIGENCHIAFNDPPADFETEAAYAVVPLDPVCRKQQVGEGWFPNLQAVPMQAYSMTVPQIMAAERILVIAPDARKAQAIKDAVDHTADPFFPASILHQHPCCDWYLDPESASLLNYKRR